MHPFQILFLRQQKLAPAYSGIITDTLNIGWHLCQWRQNRDGRNFIAGLGQDEDESLCEWVWMEWIFHRLVGTGSIPIFVQLLARVRSIEYFMAFYVQSRIILVLGEREFVIQNYSAIGTLGQVITGFLVAKLPLASHGRHFLAVLMYSFLAHDSNVLVFNCSVESKTFRIEASVWYSCSIDMNLYVARFIITSSRNVF